VLLVTDLAVATSGTYEKGTHIYDPHTGAPATELLSMTIVGPSIVEADVYATAAFAMGLAGLDFIERRAGYEAYAIDPELRGHWTTGFNAYSEGGGFDTQTSR
jgi:thiamine biosynthesis lipoprotein